jgi:DNA-binding HxlR family transcriptional regulator
MRAAVCGKQIYGELANSPERIPTNILADRLKRLEAAGIIVSTPYHYRPTRYAYTLTPKGTALGDVLLAFVRWGKQHIPGAVTLNRESVTGGSAASTPSSGGPRVKRQH